MNEIWEGLRRTCAVVIGAVFFIAGMLKLMDPVGAGLVVSEYLRFFHLGALTGVSKAAGFIMALVETLTGAALVAGVWRRTASTVTFVLLGVFTVITAIFWALKPAMDCGCFGEAVHLTHFQSFAKNVILLVLAAIAFIPMQNGFGPRRGRHVAFCIVAVTVTAFGIWSWHDLPLIDFTAYAPGARLLETVTSDEDAYTDDTAEAEEPEITTDLPILSLKDAFGSYADDLVADGDVLLVSIYDPEKISQEGWSYVAEALEGAAAAGMMPVLAVPYLDGVPVTLGEFIYFSDTKVLKTMNRSNGGASWISDGMITAKWSIGKTPSSSELSEMADKGPSELLMSRTTHRRIACQGITLGCFALLLLL